MRVCYKLYGNICYSKWLFLPVSRLNAYPGLENLEYFPIKVSVFAHLLLFSKYNRVNYCRYFTQIQITICHTLDIA